MRVPLAHQDLGVDLDAQVVGIGIFQRLPFPFGSAAIRCFQRVASGGSGGRRVSAVRESTDLGASPCAACEGGETWAYLTDFDGRDDRIRTCDPLVPNQMLYQAELHPEGGLPKSTAGAGSPLHMPALCRESVHQCQSFKSTGYIDSEQSRTRV